jgi:hypothetical protein
VAVAVVVVVGGVGKEGITKASNKMSAKSF